MMPELQFSVLGKLQINLDGQPVTGFVSSKVQALLCYLAITGMPQDRGTLATLLWGDMPDTEARTNLRLALSNLRKLVGAYLDISRETVLFNRNSPYWLDVERFQIALTQFQSVQNSSAGASLDLLRQAVELYRGDFLEGFAVRDALAFEEWLLAQRERLRQMTLQALHTLAMQHTARGEYAAGIDYTTRLLTIEPWQEEGHRQLMLLLTKSGQRSAALAQYETCRRILEEELGVEPTPETTALYERLKAAGTPRPHNLPPQPTPFVGRERELAQISWCLEQSHYRLVTLVGPGGAGKTRLALQVVAEQLSGFREGGFYVSLAAVTSSELMVTTIAAALNFPLSGPTDPRQQLLDYLQPKELLLLLDNFEQLLTPGQKNGSSVDFVAALLRTAPQLKLLITSRERLNLQEEWVIEVEGLAYPSKGAEEWRSRGAEKEETGKRGDEEAKLPDGREKLLPPHYQSLNPTGRTSLAAAPSPNLPTSLSPYLHHYSALALFVQQAHRVKTDFAVTETNQGDVIRLCQLVDGMPLGLELAATWLPVMSCQEIVTEIEHDLDFLATSLRNIPERHRSMRAVFESSWHLLSEKEQEVFRRLAVFRGGFQREAAIEVAGATLSLLLALLNKSLLRRDAAGRYDMHELVRQYAVEKLAQTPAEKAETEAKHAAYYAYVMQQQDEQLRSSHQLESVHEIERELENIQAAWQWAISRTRLDLIGQFIWSMAFFYEARDRFYEGLAVFTNAVRRLAALNELTTDVQQRQVYAQVLARQGRFYSRLTDLRHAQRSLQESLFILREVDSPRDISFVLQTLGTMGWLKGAYAEAAAYLEESHQLAYIARDRLMTALSTALLGFVAHAQGDYKQAERLLRKSLPTLREIGKLWGLGLTLDYLSRTVLALGQPAEARVLLEESLATSRELNDRWSMAHCLTQLGAMLNTMGPAEQVEAHQILQESIAIHRQIGGRWGLATALNLLGQNSCATGDCEASREYLLDALQVAQEGELAPLSLDILVNLAELWLRIEPHSYGLTTKALELLALALNHPQSEQVTRDRAARLLAERKINWSPEIVALAVKRSRERPLEAVIAGLREIE